MPRVHEKDVKWIDFCCGVETREELNFEDFAGDFDIFDHLWNPGMWYRVYIDLDHRI